MVNKVSFKTRQECKVCILSNKYVVIKISAGWCGPCKRIASLVDASLEELPASAVVIVVDFDAHRDVANALKIKSVPTFLFYMNGQPDICLVGANSKKVQNFFASVNSKILNDQKTG